MEIVYSRGSATAAEIHAALADPPTFSATRAVIRTLEEKGHIRHKEQGPRYVYLPVVPLENAGKSALAQLVSTFFHGSPSRLMATLLDDASRTLEPGELEKLEALIRKAREDAS